MKKIFEDVIAGIPDYKEFLTVEELDANSFKLAEKYPEVVSIFEMGKTREGRPLNCLKIGNGSHVGLMFCCPHPNEPIGTMLIEYFSEELARNDQLREEMDYTWYMVKAWDADGLKLNEKWLKGPYTIYNYSRNFFRPAGHKQVDWTFPIDYKELHFHDTLPESIAMMELIERIRPEFIYSLHNAGFGGVYWYVTEDTPELYDDFRKAAEKQEVPLNLGEPESPAVPELSPAVYQMLTIRSEYDYIEQYAHQEDMSKVIPCGTSSGDYAYELCKAFTFLTELPYFYDKRVDDTRESDMLRTDAVLAQLEWTSAANKDLRDIIATSLEYLNPEDPFLLAVQAFTRDDMGEATKEMIKVNPDYARKATEAEKFDSLLVNKFYKLLQYGMMARANEDELARMEEKGEDNPAKKEALTKAFEMAEAGHKKLADYLETNMDYQVVPIKKLVSIQLECGLLMADYLKNRG